MFQRFFSLYLITFAVSPAIAQAESVKTNYVVTQVVQQQMHNSCLLIAKQVLPMRIFTRLSEEVTPQVDGFIEAGKKQISISYAIPDISIRAYQLPEQAEFHCTYYLGDLGRLQLLEFGIMGKTAILTNKLHRFY